ncbi:MAG: lipoyl protein ligase domain-containing protein [Candidatus Binataceae bacterium]
MPALAPPDLLVGLQLHLLDIITSGRCAAALLLYQFQEKVVSIGRYHPYRGPAERAGITAYRRLTGGRIINPGPRWLGCSLMLPSRAALLGERDARLRPEQVMNRYTRGAMAGLRDLGADCFYPGRDAITCNRREVAMCTFEESASGALLFEMFIALEEGLESLPADLERFDPEGALTCPMYTNATSTTLSEELKRGVSFEETAQRLEAGYGSVFGGARRRDLTSAETAAAGGQISALGAQWLHHRWPDPSLNLAARASIQLGMMEARLAVAEDKVERVALYGDFIANASGLTTFEQNLAGQRLDLMTVSAIALQTYEDGSNFLLGCGDLTNLARLILKAS